MSLVILGYNVSYKLLVLLLLITIFLCNSIDVKNGLFINHLEAALDITDENRSSFKKIGIYGHQPYGILFVTAHPDDETMFFLPTIRLLNDYIDRYDKANPPLKIFLLVLTNGNSYGKGEQRESDLAKICYKLRVNEHVIHDFEIFDGVYKWPLNKVANIVTNFVIENNIRTIFTFDEHGVSYHSNHISVSKAVQIAVDKIPNFWTFRLKTVSIFRKYLSILSLHLPIFLDQSAVLYISPLLSLKLMLIYWSEFRIHIPFWCLLSSYSYSNSYSVYITPNDYILSDTWKKKV